MSAFMLSNRHLSAIVNTAYAITGLSHSRDYYTLPSDPRRLFRTLRRANAQSIAARYGHHGETVAGSEFACGEFDTSAPLLCRQDFVTAVTSLAYQACEFDGWNRSEARKMVAMMREMAADRDEGWGVASVPRAWNL